MYLILCLSEVQYIAVGDVLSCVIMCEFQANKLISGKKSCLDLYHVKTSQKTIFIVSFTVKPLNILVIFSTSRKTDMKVLLYPCYTHVHGVIICSCVKEQLPLHGTKVLGMYHQKEL